MCADDNGEASKLDVAIAFCGLFEAELLVELMLRYWVHPAAADREHANYLVEAAAEVLNQSAAGATFLEGVAAEDMNFVAAVWYAECCQVTDAADTIMEQRRDWLDKVRRALPACFCDPDNLM